MLSIPTPLRITHPDYKPAPAPQPPASSSASSYPARPPDRPSWRTQPANESGTGLLRTLSARATLREMMNPAGSWFVSEARVNGGDDGGDLSGLAGHTRIGSDWVLAEALAATPTRLKFPASESDGHEMASQEVGCVIGHHQLLPPVRIGQEKGGRWRVRRRAQNLTPPETRVEREAGPTTAPPRQTEWLGPVRPSLLEPRFSSTRVLEDVFKAGQASGMFKLDFASVHC